MKELRIANPKGTVLDSVWMRCFWEVYGDTKITGGTTINFDEVDARVLSYSRMPIDEFSKKVLK